MTKKSSPKPKAKKEVASPKKHEPIAPLVDDASVLDAPIDEPDVAADQFAVAGREDEASSTGHRVEPIEEDDEHNAEKLIEEGLHGYVRASPNHTHRGR
jgi:hypothetical protein